MSGSLKLPLKVRPLDMSKFSPVSLKKAPVIASGKIDGSRSGALNEPPVIDRSVFEIWRSETDTVIGGTPLKADKRSDALPDNT